MQIHKYIRELLFLLFVLYFAQGSFYESSSVISKSALLLIFLISGVYLAKTILLKNKKNHFFYAWTLLLLINLAGFVFTADFSSGAHASMFKRILGCMLPFYPFYYFAFFNCLKAKHLVRFLLMMLPVMILQFYIHRSQVLLEIGGDEATNMVNNVAYTFVRLMPFVFLIKKRRILSFAIMLVMSFFVIQGAKRGAIISAALILFIFYYFQMRSVEKGNRLIGYLAALIGVVGLSIFVYQYFMENEFLINRMISLSEGQTSGRTLLYSRILDGWSGSHNLLNLLFGYGFAASIELTGINFAHNDWLELLSNFGLLGVAAYIYLFYAAAKYVVNPFWSSEKKILMFAVTLVWFFITLVSMWYSSLSGYTQAILLAYLVGSRQKGLD